MFRMTEPVPDNAQRFLRLRWVEETYNGELWLKYWLGSSKVPKYCRFRTEAIRAEYLADLKAKQAASEARREQRREEQKARAREMADKIQVGTLLHYSWGYDQTNCDYFQVIEKRGMQVTIREIGCVSVPGSEGFMCDRRKPNPNHFIGPPMRKRISPYGVSMAHGSASPCSADAESYCSWYA